MDAQSLVEEAKKAREKAHAPYSGFKVGAALLAQDGTVFPGCNVENASYGATICAERSALVSAVSQGRRRFRAIAVVADTDGPCVPCGLCRQVLSEFGGYHGDLVVIMANLRGDIESCAIHDLLPRAFSSDFLGDDSIEERGT